MSSRSGCHRSRYDVVPVPVEPRVVKPEAIEPCQVLLAIREQFRCERPEPARFRMVVEQDVYAAIVQARQGRLHVREELPADLVPAVRALATKQGTVAFRKDQIDVQRILLNLPPPQWIVEAVRRRGSAPRGRYYARPVVKRPADDGLIGCWESIRLGRS
jgi:hypothetical protein